MDVANNDGQKCLTEEELVRLAANGDLPPDRGSHLENCQECKERVERHPRFSKEDLGENLRIIALEKLLKDMQVARYGAPRREISVFSFFLLMVIIVETFFLALAIIRVNGLDRCASIEEGRANAAERALAKLAKDCPNASLDKGSEKE